MPEKRKIYLRIKLEFFNVFYKQAQIPSILEQHISDLRKLREALSPNAIKITKFVHSARSLSEQDGINKLVKRLLLVLDRNDGIERAAKLNLNTQFLPPAIDVEDESLHLEKPQPDHCFGYLPLRKAKAIQAMKWPFTTMEEKILARYINSISSPLSHLQLRLNLIDNDQQC